MRKGGGHIYDGIDISILTGGVLNDYERGSSCFAGPCSHPHLHRRGTPAGIEEQFVASEVPQTVPMMLPDNDWRGCKLKSASPHLRLLATSTRKSTLSVRTNGIERLPHAVHIKMVAAIGIHVLVEQRGGEQERRFRTHMPFGTEFLDRSPNVDVFPGIKNMGRASQTRGGS